MQTDEECEEIYFAALLHDVGKIGVDDRIINKDGKLNDEEFAQIKLHPIYGSQILSQIHQSPNLYVRRDDFKEELPRSHASGKGPRRDSQGIRKAVRPAVRGDHAASDRS